MDIHTLYRSILKHINNLFLQVSSTLPSEVDCGSIVGVGVYHRHEGHDFCHPVDRLHGKVGRPKGTSEIEMPAVERKPEIAVSGRGYIPPINGRIAAQFAIPDDYGEPVKVPRSSIDAVFIEAPEEFKNFIKETFEVLPRKIIQGTTVKIDETKDEILSEVDVQKKVIVLRKLPRKDSPLTSDAIRQNLYHQQGHFLYNELLMVARQIPMRSDGYFRSAQGHPRAFITTVSKNDKWDWWAEFFSYYVMHPKWVWIRHPGMYNLFYNKVMEGTEYRKWNKTINP